MCPQEDRVRFCSDNYLLNLSMTASSNLISGTFDIILESLIKGIFGISVELLIKKNDIKNGTSLN